MRWGEYGSREEIVEAIRNDLGGYPGVQLNFTQPIQNAFDELLSGSRAELAIKVYGEDLTVLRETSQSITEAVRGVPGLVDLATEQGFGQPQVQIVTDREACARYGVSVAQIMETVELAIGGEVIDHMYLNVRRYGIHLRLQEGFRDDPESISSLLVHTGDGSLITLSMVADVNRSSDLFRSTGRRTSGTGRSGNIDGRDLGSVVADVQRAIEENVDMPPDTSLSTAVSSRTSRGP